MELTVTFEHWMLGDGTSPPLRRSDLVNIALQLQTRDARPVPPGSPLALEPLGPARYRVVADVLKTFPGDREHPTIAIHAGPVGMYIEDCELPEARAGSRVEAVGTLSFDYYHWSEFLARLPDSPDLFHRFRVERIQRVPIPDRFIRRTDRSLSFPTHVDPAEWDSERVVEVEGMAEDTITSFYLVDLDDATVGIQSVPRTYIG